MLAVARANLERAELHANRVELRQGDVYAMPFERATFDLVVVHQVLHYLDDPGRAVTAAARLVAPGGRLLIVDFAPHSLEFLQAGGVVRQCAHAASLQNRGDKRKRRGNPRRFLIAAGSTQACGPS